MSAEDINRALGDLHASNAAQAAEAQHAQQRFAGLQAQMPAVVSALRAAGVPTAMIDVGPAPPAQGGRLRRRLQRRRRVQGPGWLVHRDYSAMEYGRVAVTEDGTLLVGNPAIGAESLDKQRADDVARAFAAFLRRHGIERITV